MKVVLRILCIALSVLICVSLLGACGGGSEETSSVDPDKLVNEYISTADICYVNADGMSTYRLIRPESGEQSEASAAKVILDAIKEKCGVSPKNRADDEDGNGVAEILIGNTNRDASAKAKQLLLAQSEGRYGEFIICTIDDDIVIFGETADAIVAGAQYFADNYVKNEVITGGINYVHKVTGDFKPLAIAGNSKLNVTNVVRPIYNVSYLTQTETDKLIEAIKTKTGYKMPLVNDQVASTNYLENEKAQTDGSGTLTRANDTEYEIIIGNCVRDGVKIFNDVNKYEIRVEGKKVYLNGGSSHATALAVSEFIKLVENNAEITTAVNVLDGDYNETIKNYDNATYYMPTWWDDFEGVGTDIDPDGFGLNYNNWNIPWDMKSSYSNAPNGKDQYRCNKELRNTYVQDGKLYMCAMETEDAYYGGWFDTTTTMYYRYGLIENSTLHPKGMGFWNALWGVSHPEVFSDIVPECQDALYHLETDVDECYGPGTWAYGNTFAWLTTYGRLFLQVPADQQGTVHVNNKVTSMDDRGYWMDFHTFGFEWLDKTHVRFTCDGYVFKDQPLREGAEQLAYSQPSDVIIGYAVGSGNHGIPTTDPVEWSQSNKFVNDWVYIYQLKGQDLWLSPNKNGTGWVNVRG